MVRFVVLVLLLVFGGIGFSLNSYAADKSGVTPNVVSLPKGPGAIEGLGESFQPSLNSGTADYGLTIKVPPGTAGRAPALRLQYEGGGGNGPLGFGWNLPLASVQRRTDKGIPVYDQNVGFAREDIFINHSKEELVPLASGFWFCKNEGGFVRYRRVSTHWEGTMPDGTALVFGSTPAARITGQDTNQVFCWLLQEERDTHSNTIVYAYTTFPGTNNFNQKYLDTITYGPGAPPWASFHFVKFVYEDRSDWFEDCRAGFIVRTGKRVKEIVVGTQGPVLTNHLAGDFNGDGQTDYLNRKYVLQYAPYAGANSHWSLLAKMTMLGADGISALPPASFGYTVCNPPDTLSAAGHIVGGENEPITVMDNGQVDFLELNGDGLPDILRTDPGSSTHWGYLNRGQVSGPNGPSIQWQSGTELESEDGRAVQFNLQSVTPIAHLADMDGNGVADLAVTALDGSVLYFANRASRGWGPRQDMSVQDTTPPSPFGNADVRTADLDFDKRIDIIQSISTGNGADYRIWFNIGNQSYSSGITVAQSSGLMLSTPGVQIADFNGDRVPDMVWLRPQWLVVTAGLGYGRFADPIQVHLPDPGLDETQIATATLTDLNGDGLPDLALERAAPGQLWYWLNLGNYSLSGRKIITGMPSGGGANVAIRWVDLNGNGTADLVYADSSFTPRLQTVDIGSLLNCGATPNLMVAISNGIGRVTLIGYESSTVFAVADAAAGKPWPDLMPNPVTVVAAVTNLDSLGHQYVTRFRYHNGYYDSEEKQFRGFARAEQIDAGDVTAPTLVTRSTFDTGRHHEALKGKLLEVSFEQEDGKVFSVETNAWTVPPVTLYTGSNGADVVFAHPTGTIKIVSELGQGMARRLETEVAYDAYGNETTNANYGIVEGGLRAAWNDERIVVTEYARNLDAWIVRFPKRQETRTFDATVISRREHFYDDPTFSGANLGAISFGNKTLTRDWILPSNSGAFVKSDRGIFDVFGNKVVTLDPLGVAQNTVPDLTQGHIREITYDSRFHTYPVAETVHVGAGAAPLVFRAGYDEGFGTPTFSLDFNSHQTTYGYDSFGRLTQIVKPYDTAAYPTVEYHYALAQPVGTIGIVNYIETRELDKAPGLMGESKRDHYHVSRRFVDGFTRTLMLKVEAEPANPGGPPRAVISSATEFNARLESSAKVNACFSIVSGANLDDLLAYESITAPEWQGTFGLGGQLVNLPLATGHKVVTTYDAILRSLSTVNQDGTVQRTAYEPLITKATDENQAGPSPYPGHTTIEYHDGLGRLVRVDEVVRLADDGGPSGAINVWSTHYEYDANDQLTRIIDSQNNSKEMRYDGLKRSIFVNDPDRGVMLYTYDDASNLTGTLDAKDQRIVYTYDGANRLLSERYIGSSLSPRLGEDRGEGSVHVAYHYDAPVGVMDNGDGSRSVPQNTRGMLAFVSDGSGEEHISYDARGRAQYIIKRIPEPSSTVHPGNLVAYRTTFEYDSLDRLTRLVYPDNDEVRYHYNDRTLLSRIAGGPTGSIVSNVVYWASDRQRQLDYGNNTTTSHGYDARLRLESLDTLRPQDVGRPLLSFRYSFDPVSNIKTIEDRRPLTVLPTGAKRRNTQFFDYDALHRLTRVQYSFNAPGTAPRNDGEINYRYDRIGNLLSQTSSIDHQEKGLPAANIGMMQFGGDGGASNRRGRSASDPPGPHALTSVVQAGTEPRIYNYDRNGNMASLDGLACTWDFKDRLVAAEDDGMRVEYTYDYTDRRITKRVVPKGDMAPAKREASAVYVNEYFEVREYGAPVKYVLNGESRIVRVIGSLSANLRIQRIPVQTGWNLRSVAVTAANAVAQLSRSPSAIAAVYKWVPASSNFVAVNTSDTLPAGTVVWIAALTNASLVVTGAYAEPTNLVLPVGGSFIASAGLETWNLSNALPATATVWKPRSGATGWNINFGQPLRDNAAASDYLGAGEAWFVQLAAPVELPSPDAALRLLYYHEDHIGSSGSVTDAQGRLVSESAYYPYGGQRVTYLAETETSAYYSFSRKERDAEHGMLNFDTRLLWPATARFIRVDSLADKYKERRLHVPQSLNPYAYCHNNPLVLSDPDGREARVILHGKNQITIQVAIQYVGPLATKENIARANKGIEKRWTGKVGRYNIKMVVVDPAKDPTLQPAVITLTDKDAKGKYLRSFVQVRNDTGQWNPKDSDFNWVAAHETGHLLGLDDRYTDNKWGGSVADKGWRGNMMAETGGRLEERNIEELTDTSGKVYLRSSKGVVRHHRKVFDRSPEAAAANQAALERDMLNQMRAWQANP